MVPWLAVTRGRAKHISGSLCPWTQLGHLQTVAAVIAAMCLEFIFSTNSRKCVPCFLPELWCPAWASGSHPLMRGHFLTLFPFMATYLL